LPIPKASYKAFIAAVLIAATVSCSVEKNTGATRFYHSMTARYNIYFNGYESFKAGLDKIEAGYTDDYAAMLNVFEFNDPDASRLCAADMDRAIQKASKLISLKSITAIPEDTEAAEQGSDLLNRKEYNEWVDDSYLLIGMARFYKREFSEAEALFNYSISTANDPEIRTEATIWLARTKTANNSYPEAFRILSGLDNDALQNKRLRAMYQTSMADLFIKQQRYDEAVGPLSLSIKYLKGKREKYRLTYLLAQLNENLGNSQQAISLYREVVKMNPPYDVEFNARINIAGVFDISSGNPDELRKELERMMKDIKNVDYLDQIYFALGTLAFKEGNEEEALSNFRKSAAVQSRNPNQKSRTYKALADYYYSKADFINAGKYYDSTVAFLDKNHAEYQTLFLRAQNLEAVVSQLEIISREDSLQKVASMSESERNALISGIIAEITRAESEGTSSAYTDRYNLGQFYENERRFQNNIDQEGKWYFYNQSALTFGRTEFRRRWGERALEDNWRRSNKATTVSGPSVDNAPDANNAAEGAQQNVPDYKNPEFYLKDLPLNDSLLKLSDSRIALAALNAGKAYAEKIGDPAKATSYLEIVLKRFPSSQLVPETLYNLYNINRDVNPALSETYRQRLLAGHPGSEFAMMLSDPDYYTKKMAALIRAETMYHDAYNMYQNEKFRDAIILCDTALANFPENDLAPKFMLLRSFATARISDDRTFRNELNALIKKWPASEEGKRAAEIIEFMNKEKPGLMIEEEKVIAQELFRYDSASVHTFALVINDPSFNINQATFDVISYNIDNYTNNNYKTQGELVDNKYIIITVTGFRNYDESFAYFDRFDVVKLVRNQSQSEMYSFIITEENLQILKNDRNPSRYRLFFIEKYLNEKDKDTVDR